MAHPRSRRAGPGGCAPKGPCRLAALGAHPVDVLHHRGDEAGREVGQLVVVTLPRQHVEPVPQPRRDTRPQLPRRHAGARPAHEQRQVRGASEGLAGDAQRSWSSSSGAVRALQDHVDDQVGGADLPADTFEDVQCGNG